MSRNALQHEHFEELAALAAIARLPVEDWMEFVEHVSGCARCQAQYVDMAELFRIQLPHLSAGAGEEFFQEMTFTARRDKRVKSEFFARARKEGLVPLEPRKRDWREFWDKCKVVLRPPQAYAYGVAIVALIAAVAFGNALRLSRQENGILQGRVAGFEDEARKNQQVSSRVERAAAPADDAEKMALRKEEERYSVLLAQYKTLQEELRQSNDRLRDTEAQVVADQNKEAEFSKRLVDASAELGTRDSDLQNARDTHARDLAAAKQQEREIDELQARVAAANVALERERELMAADRDIRDLMGARSLHITDIFDVDDRGRTQRATGRVFYTEGKSLIVYAFDLAKPGLLEARHTFQAWGYRESDRNSARSLGILYMDDKKQNRWVLKFADPEVLRAIDTVFVTMEPSGGSDKPSGHRLLYAYLNSAPNHP
jgi:hypothetical protein